MVTFTYGIVWYGESEPKYGLIQITDTVGRVITFSYSVGKLMSVTDGVRTTTYSYSGDRMVGVADPLGRVTTYDYMDESSFLITGVHYPSGGFSSYEYAAVSPEEAKLAPYKGSVTINGVPTYYAYKVDSSDTISWTSPGLLNSMTLYAGRPYILQRDDGSLVMYYKDIYVWTEKVWKCQAGDCWWETITHTEYWIKRSMSTDQQHWSTPQNVVQVKSTTGNPVVIEKRDGSLIMYYKDTNTPTDYWIYRRTSSDGITWGSAVKFQQTTLSVRNIAAIQVIDKSFLLCYTDKVGSLYYIRQITSADGITWSSPSNILQVDSYTGNPALIQKNTGEVYLAYRKNANIYLLTNTGGGWSSPVQTTAQAQNDPCLLLTDEIVIIYKGTDNHFYRISSANGSNWSSPLQIAPNTAFSDPSSVYRKDKFYRVTAQYISESALNTVKITEFSYNGDGKIPSSSDVIIRDSQTVRSSIHLEYDSEGRITNEITKDENGVQTEKIVYTYNSSGQVIQQSVYRGTSQDISFSIAKGYDNWGNTVYTRDPEGAEHFYSYSNSSSANQFTDSKGVPVTLFSNTFYTNTIPSNCHTLLLGEAFINNGKVKEVYNKYDAKGNVTETKTLFPTRTYADFSGVFAEPNQTTFQFDLTGLTVTNGILVITSVPVPTSEIVYETHSEPGTGWHNTGTWNQKSFYADYTKCTGLDCYDGQTEIGPFDHYPGSPNYTGYTTWIEDNTQYVKTSYSAIVNEYPKKVEYSLNSGSWTEITSNLGSGTTSITISADQFIQGVNTLQFRDSNTYSTKLEWTLYLNQGATPQQYVTTYTHDTYGNLTSLTDAEGHTTTYGYSAQYQYAYLTSKTSIVDGQPVTTSATYDFQTGQITSRTCACGSVTNYEYDAVGRLTKVIYPLVFGELERAEYEIIYDDVNNTVTLFNENDEKTMRYYDGLGRMIKTETYKNALRSHRTQETYLYAVKQICDFFKIEYGEFDPRRLDQEKYDEFLGIRSKELKRTSLNLLSNVFKILSDLYGLGIKVKLLDTIDKHTDYISFAELQEIINKADKEAAAVTAFMFCTGLRPVSVLSIKKEQLVLNAAHPYVKGVLLKGGRRQDIIIMYHEMVKPLLNWYLQYKSTRIKDYHKNEYVFVSQRGKTTESYIYELVRACSTIIGRNISPRMLRKGLGVHTKELGLQDEVRRMIMAHKDVKTTIDAYSDYTIKDIVRELEQKIPSSNNASQATSSLPNAPPREKCPFCGGFVESEMLLCPHCWEEIKIVCNGCKRFIQVNWKKCPYCGVEVEREKKEKKFEHAL